MEEVGEEGAKYAVISYLITYYLQCVQYNSEGSLRVAFKVHWKMLNIVAKG